MAPKSMKAHITEAPGFIAALDQSGGSTPGALRLYGIPDSAYSGDAEMFGRSMEILMALQASTKKVPITRSGEMSRILAMLSLQKALEYSAAS